MEIQLIKRRILELRKQHLWSQEELAAASGLGLRTIQRAENEGIASAETVKALTATFNVDRDELIQANSDALPYFNIQLGYVTLGVTLIVAAMGTWSFRSGLLSDTGFAVLMFVSGVIAALFATLSTRVDEHAISWSMGLGVIRKSISLDQIKAHKIVRNKAWWGWGIRLIPDGWLYSVSGLNGVELKLADGRVFRVGTDEAAQLNRALEQALNQ